MLIFLILVVAELYISYDGKIVVVINSTNFDGNGCSNIPLECFCYGGEIESSNHVFEHNQFLFKSTNFLNYSYAFDLRTNGKAIVELSNVNVYNNDLNGISITSSEVTNVSMVILNITSATFVNGYGLSVDVDTVIISSATFIQSGI